MNCPNQPHTTHLTRARFAVGLGLAGLLLPAAMGQEARPTTPAAKQTPAKSEEVASLDETLHLGTFTVESKRDYGYRSTNSMTATGSGESIHNTPLSIAVINRDLIDDKGSVDLVDLLRDIPGVSASSTSAYDVYSRGFDSTIKIDGSEQLGMELTTYNVERVEMVKGAVSVLQGHASAGGVVNSISRRPKFTPQHTISAAFGSFEKIQGGFIATGPLIDRKLAYLVNYNYLDQKGWVKDTFRTDNSIQFGLEYRPIERLSINLDLQFLERKSAGQQHLTFTHPAFLAAELEAQALYDSKGLARPAAYPRLNETTRAWLDRTAGFGVNEPSEVVNVNELMYPDGYRARVAGPQGQGGSNNEKGLAEIKYQLAKDWEWRTVYNLSEQEQYGFGYGATFRMVGGMILRERATRSRDLRKRSEVSTEVAGRFKFLGMRHRLLTGFNYRTYLSASQTQSTGVIAINPRTDPPLNVQSVVLAQFPNGLPSPVFSRTIEHAPYFNDQIAAFDERLHVMVGGRWGYRKQRSIEGRRFVPQVGAVYALPGIEGLSVYSSYGESFRPNYILDADGNVPDPTIEKNLEGGLRLDLWDGKLSGTISTYNLEQANKAIRDHAREADTGRSPLYMYAGKARSRGAEVDLIWTPTKNYQVKFAYSRIWEARTLDSDDLRMVGVRHKNAPESQVSVWSKYTFTNTFLKGTYFAGGVQWFGETRLHASWASPVYSDNTWDVTLSAGKSFRLAKGRTLTVSARVDNVTDEFFYQHTFRPNDPRRFSMDMRYVF